MTLHLTSDFVYHAAMYPEKGKVFDINDPDDILYHVSLLFTGEQFKEEYEKGEWEYDSDEEHDLIGFDELKNPPYGDKYDEWEASMVKEWWKTFGKMWLDGSFNRENGTFPYKRINPEASDDLYVEVYRFTSRGMYYTDTVWETEGFDEGDYLLGEELGLLTPRNSEELKDEIDFNKMIDEYEEIEEEAQLFLDEYVMICEGGSKLCEVIQLNDIREFVEVKIDSIGKKFGIGTIDGRKEVFIPINVLKKYCEEQYSSEYFKDMNEEELDRRKSQKYDENTSNINYGELKVGEICLMDIRFTGYETDKKNIWRVVKIHPKIIHIKGAFIPSSGKKVFDIEMPLQNICGKNEDLKNYRKKIIEEYPLMNEFWSCEDYFNYCKNGWKDDYEELIIEDMYYPKIQITNSDVTCVKIFQDIINISWPKYVQCACSSSSDTCELCKHEKEPAFKRYTLMSGFDTINGIVRKNML